MNKARRRRDTTSSATAGASVYELYTVHGDASAALNACSSGCEDPGQKDNYNRDLLSYMASESGYSSESRNSMVSKMEEWEKKFGNKESFPSLPARKRARNEWIAAYNRALLLLANGDIPKSSETCAEKLRTIVLGKKKASSEMSMVSTRMAFLFLEGILSNSLASFSGLQHFEEELTAENVMGWLEVQEPESDPQFKFLLALYKSRLDFAERDASGKHVDAKIRSSRKELKTAMEVFQHKLRPSGSGEESLASSWEADSDVQNNNNNNASSGQQQNPPMSLILQKQNQAALNLKANVEHLKGNAKKSLILLGEALAAAPEEDSFYENMHANNLALVYETNGKRHLAMHAIAKALRVDLRKPNFQSDGTARPDPSLLTLYNAALCALQARKFSSAYESMNACVKHSNIFSKRHRCWLLMAEACIGIHADNKRSSTPRMFSTIEVQGEPKGIMIHNDSRSYKTDAEGDWFQFGTPPDDISEVKKYPLLCARTCLESALQLLNEKDEKDIHALASTRLCLAYVSLELRNFGSALNMAQLVVEQDESLSAESEAKKRIYKRQIATARMYAAEASCALGDAAAAMRYLVGDGQDDAFNRLASELGGVTIEVAATNRKGKARLARAQSMVRSSASAASAVLGNIGPAKQLAMSAQAMEDAYSGSRDRSTARKALVYCMLREGNSGAALTLLRSLS